MTHSLTQGRCLCGNVRFQVEGKPVWIGHCHCQSCRRNTGSVLATFVGFKPSQVTYLNGEQGLYESSPGVRRRFCTNCGTPLSYEADKFPNEIHLYLCTLDEPERYVPQFHVFYSERVPWFEVADNLPRHLRVSSQS